MKKFLTVLAVVALVAFAAPAFAANPFMDVPAGHWAYDAVAQLAADGIISGVFCKPKIPTFAKSFYPVEGGEFYALMRESRTLLL